MAALVLLTGCEQMLGLDEFGRTAPGASVGTGGGGGDDRDGPVGGAAGAAGSVGTEGIGPGDPAVPTLGWASVLAGRGSSEVGALAVAPDGSVAMCGSFDGELRVGEQSLLSHGDTAPDIYVARFAPDGSVLAMALGDEAADGCRGVAFDDEAVLHFTGAIEGTVSFGDTVLAGTGAPRAYVASMDRTGDVVGALQAAGTGESEGMAMALVPASDGLLLVGRFTGQLQLGGATLSTTTQAATFAAELAGTSATWAAAFGDDAPGSGSDQLPAAAAVTDGGVVVVGTYAGAVAPAGGPSLPERGGTDVFLLALGPTGQHRWASGVGGPGDDAVGSVAAAPAGGVVVVGSFQEQLTVGEQTFAGTGPADRDGFAMQLDAAGRLEWLRTFTGLGDAEVHGVAVDPLGNVYLAGSFAGQLEHEGGSLGADGTDGWFAVLASDGRELHASALTGPAHTAARAVAVDAVHGGAMLAVEFEQWVDLIARQFDGGGDDVDMLITRVDWIR